MQVVSVEHLTLLVDALGLVQGVLGEGVVAADLGVEGAREEAGAEPVFRGVDGFAVAVGGFAPGVAGLGGAGRGFGGGGGGGGFGGESGGFGGCGWLDGRGRSATAASASASAAAAAAGCGWNSGGGDVLGDLGWDSHVRLVITVGSSDDNVELLAVLAHVCCHRCVNVGTPESAFEARH